MGNYSRSKRTLKKRVLSQTGHNMRRRKRRQVPCGVAEMLFEQKEVVVNNKISRFEKA